MNSQIVYTSEEDIFNKHLPLIHAPFRSKKLNKRPGRLLEDLRYVTFYYLYRRFEYLTRLKLNKNKMENIKIYFCISQKLQRKIIYIFFHFSSKKC